jgi:hypothetical protein
VDHLADVVGGGAEEHGLGVEVQPAGAPVGELGGDIVHGTEGGQSGRGLELVRQFHGAGRQRSETGLGQGAEQHTLEDNRPLATIG